MAPQTPAQRAANEKYARRELAKKGKRVAPTYKSKLDKKPARKIPFGYIAFFLFLILGTVFVEAIIGRA
ncbi:hypothetical protein B9G98_01066 [Wickerhamiella sorbophila]|uniref:Stress-associated endoplasmic reticulum protein n=1 Tax=Wickerhamiella sorbophila TaxID=45607 RepID=A0A2T0FEM0_9ASCO|nr:hypothetical protein B9G98_01066 [Wickerhamiella sorbophila]PRT53446.1 hypothetical protein B9G98_01066 [Wickerhamiella sorbophila]